MRRGAAASRTGLGLRPFGIAGICIRRPARSYAPFASQAPKANELVSDSHDRIPAILPAQAYDCWLSNIEPDLRDPLVPFPSELMTMWQISARVNKSENDDSLP